MFRITEDPSSGSLVQCLATNYKKDSIVSVDMDKVGVVLPQHRRSHAPCRHALRGFPWMMTSC
jgi:hypothetical protein